MELAAPKAKMMAKSKAKSKKRAVDVTEDLQAPSTPKKRKGGDEELLQIDLRRQQVIAKNNAASCWQTNYGYGLFA